jgi:hypothetical protein
MRRTKWLFRLGLAGKRPWTGVPKDLAAQVHLSLTLKEAVPKHDLYSHPMFSTLRSLPFRPADWSLASPFLNPITYASFEMVAPEMEPFFLVEIQGDSYQGTAFQPCRLKLFNRKRASALACVLVRRMLAAPLKAVP